MTTTSHIDHCWVIIQQDADPNVPLKCVPGTKRPFPRWDSTTWAVKTKYGEFLKEEHRIFRSETEAEQYLALGLMVRKT